MVRAISLARPNLLSCRVASYVMYITSRARELIILLTAIIGIFRGQVELDCAGYSRRLAKVSIIDRQALLSDW